MGGKGINECKLLPALLMLDEGFKGVYVLISYLVLLKKVMHGSVVRVFQEPRIIINPILCALGSKQKFKKVSSSHQTWESDRDCVAQ